MYNSCCRRSHSLSLYTIIVREEREEKKKKTTYLEACSRLNPLLHWPLSVLVLETMVACVIIVVAILIH